MEGGEHFETFIGSVVIVGSIFQATFLIGWTVLFISIPNKEMQIHAPNDPLNAQLCNVEPLLPLYLHGVAGTSLFALLILTSYWCLYSEAPCSDEEEVKSFSSVR